MKWSGKGEFKTLHSVIEISRLNAGADATPAAILFGQSESVALKTLLSPTQPSGRSSGLMRSTEICISSQWMSMAFASCGL